MNKCQWGTELECWWLRNYRTANDIRYLNIWNCVSRKYRETKIWLFDPLVCIYYIRRHNVESISFDIILYWISAKPIIFIMDSFYAQCIWIIAPLPNAFECYCMLLCWTKIKIIITMVFIFVSHFVLFLVDLFFAAKTIAA